MAPADAATFHVGLQRLAVVVAWAEPAQDAERLSAWANGAARIPLPDPTRRALVAALGA